MVPALILVGCGGSTVGSFSLKYPGKNSLEINSLNKNNGSKKMGWKLKQTSSQSCLEGENEKNQDWNHHLDQYTCIYMHMFKHIHIHIHALKNVIFSFHLRSPGSFLSRYFFTQSHRKVSQLSTNRTSAFLRKVLWLEPKAEFLWWIHGA